jgi:plasmid maintenance system antidote protein VapI
MAAKRLSPVHPGILLHDFMAPNGLTSYRVAKELGVSLADAKIGKQIQKRVQPTERAKQVA